MSSAKSLDALRREIDTVDGAIQDLLIERTRIVERIRRVKGDGEAHLRPGREARILRALMARHRGAFPKGALVRIWREIIGVFVGLQGPFSVAVYDPPGRCGFGDLARGQYGSIAPMTGFASVRQVLDSVMRGDATVGVLPMPGRDDDDPWWPHIASEEPTMPRVVARLPFAGSGNARDGVTEALVIGRVTPESTGRDRTFLVLDAHREFSLLTLAPALAEAGLATTLTASWGDPHAPGTWLYLAEVDDFVDAADRRLVRLLEGGLRPVRRVIVMGSYAVPLTAAELAPAPKARRRGVAGPKAAS